MNKILLANCAYCGKFTGFKISGKRYARILDFIIFIMLFAGIWKFKNSEYGVITSGMCQECQDKKIIIRKSSKIEMVIDKILYLFWGSK